MTTVVDALSIPCSPRTKREADLKELSVQQREKTMGRLDHERVHSVKHRQPHTHTPRPILVWMDSQGRDVGDFVQACRHIVQVAVGYAATFQGSATRVSRCPTMHTIRKTQ